LEKARRRGLRTRTAGPDPSEICPGDGGEHYLAGIAIAAHNHQREKKRELKSGGEGMITFENDAAARAPLKFNTTRPRSPRKMLSERVSVLRVQRQIQTRANEQLSDLPRCRASPSICSTEHCTDVNHQKDEVSTSRAPGVSAGIVEEGSEPFVEGI